VVDCMKPRFANYKLAVIVSGVTILLHLLKTRRRFS
jgi:hypothetical protein